MALNLSFHNPDLKHGKTSGEGDIDSIDARDGIDERRWSGEERGVRPRPRPSVSGCRSRQCLAESLRCNCNWQLLSRRAGTEGGAPVLLVLHVLRFIPLSVHIAERADPSKDSFHPSSLDNSKKCPCV